MKIENMLYSRRYIEDLKPDKYESYSFHNPSNHSFYSNKKNEDDQGTRGLHFLEANEITESSLCLRLIYQKISAF